MTVWQPTADSGWVTATSATASVDDTALGYRAGTTDFRRVVASLFAAGVATFALLYSTQALLPEP